MSVVLVLEPYFSASCTASVNACSAATRFPLFSCALPSKDSASDKRTPVAAVAGLEAATSCSADEMAASQSLLSKRAQYSCCQDG